MIPKRIKFDVCDFILSSPDFCETVFKDGTKYNSYPLQTPSYYALTRELGYDNNIQLMNIEEHFFHHLIAMCAGKEFSPSIWAAAHHFSGTSIPQSVRIEEDHMVHSFQKMLNIGERDGNIVKFESVHNKNADEIIEEYIHGLLDGTWDNVNDTSPVSNI